MVKNILSISPFLPPNIGGVESLVLRLNKLTNKNNFIVHQVGYYPLNSDVNYKREEISGSYIYYRLQWFGKGLFNKLENKSFFLTFIYLFPALFCFTIYKCITKIKFSNINTLHAYGFISALIVVLLNIFQKKDNSYNTFIL